MSWTYSGPKTGLKDQVRFAVGDTRKSDPYLQDEEIAFLLEQSGNNPGAAAVLACEAIIAQLSRSRDETVGSVSISFSQQVAAFEKLAARLTRRTAINGDIAPYAGGISHMDKALTRQNRDWNRPDFSTDMMRSPWAAQLKAYPSGVDWGQWPLDGAVYDV